MEFNELQSRLWNNMLKAIEDFKNGKIKYFDLVYELEGALDAGEFRDKSLTEQWYHFWTPLEILYATKGNTTTIDDANKYLLAMEEFLSKISSNDSSQEK